MVIKHPFKNLPYARQFTLIVSILYNPAKQVIWLSNEITGFQKAEKMIHNRIVSKCYQKYSCNLLTIETESLGRVQCTFFFPEDDDFFSMWS